MSERTSTPIDAIAEAWVETLIELDPGVAVWIGSSTPRLGEYGDNSPAGHETWADAARAALTAVEAATPVDETDVVTRTDLAADLRLGLELHEAQEHLRDLNVIASPAQDIREILDLLPTATSEDWSVISARLTNLPGALAGYVATLREGAARGLTPARRQVVEVIIQADELAARGGFFDGFVGGAAPAGGVPPALGADLERGAVGAAAAYGAFAAFLRDQLLPVATSEDAVGREDGAEGEGERRDKRARVSGHRRRDHPGVGAVIVEPGARFSRHRLRQRIGRPRMFDDAAYPISFDAEHRP